MKFISLFSRLGLLALGFLLVAIVNDDAVWASPSDTTPTTSGLADALLHEWGLAMMVLGMLMAMAMMGAAYLVRDERRENLLLEFGGEEE